MAIVWMILVQFVWMPPYKGELVNVALKKPASMSSRYEPDNRNFSAANAVDGNTIAVSPSIIHTDVGKTFAWWLVDLQTQVQDSTVKIYFRIYYKMRRNGVKLYTSQNTIPYPPSGGTPCHAFTDPVPDIDSVNCSGSWRYLMVHTNTIDDESQTILDFGEVEVIVCSSGTYGNNCTKSCNSRQCSVSSTSCPRYTGACPSGGCQAGWMETDCTQECTYGSYGLECTMPCNSRKCTGPSSCDLVTGQCDRGCLPGWNGTDCTKQCSGGTYGDSCVQLCESRHCLVQSDTCDHVTGACSVDGCRSGWNGTDCTLDDALTGTDLDKLTFGVIGAVIGAVVAIVVGAVILICLVRHGRIEWKKPEDSRQSAEMSDLSNRHGSSRTAAENPKSNTAHVYNNEYSVLDSTTKSENRVYDVIHDKDKDYQNV